MSEVWRSLCEHVRTGGVVWLSVLPGGVGGGEWALGKVRDVPTLPTAFWIAAFLGGLIVVQFSTFHRARVARDQACRDRDSALQQAAALQAQPRTVTNVVVLPGATMNLHPPALPPPPAPSAPAQPEEPTS